MQTTTWTRKAERSPLARALDADLFRVLADPTRLHLLACVALCDGGCTMGEVAACCEVDLSVVSRHLSKLAGQGVLERIEDGRTVRYALRPSSLSARLRAMADAVDASPGSGGCCAGGCDR